MLPGADRVTAAYFTQTTFFDCGGNWSGVSCPGCGAGAEGWWTDAMDTASARDFQDLGYTAPCCGLRTSLNELAFHWPVAFGRFALVTLNPGAELPAANLSELEQTLGCRLTAVRRHL